MLKIGKYNTLRVARRVDFGVYLETGDGGEILLPNRYVPQNTSIGDEIEVFVYTDSDDRLIATTEKPFATVGEFAYLQVRDVNSTGAFLDWGITAKDLLVPYSQQKSKMSVGGVYLVYLYLDDLTKRVAASAKVEHFLGNVYPEYKAGAKVKALVVEHTPIGYKVIVDNLHRGILYENELYRPVAIEETVDAYVKNVRQDGKIDLTLAIPVTRDRIEVIAEEIIEAMKAEGGALGLNDKSSPEEIKAAFACSKKDFKKALGMLYKQGKISIQPELVKLI